MSYKDQEYEEIIEEFTKIEKRIEELKPTTDRETFNIYEKKLVNAYNNIIRKTRQYWSSKDSILKENLKTELSKIYYRLKTSLSSIKSSVNLPNNISLEVQLDNSEDDLLQSTLTYDKDTFNELLNDFDEWDRKITRKNASEKEEVVALRTKKIIEAYNKLVEFTNPILNLNDDTYTDKLRKEVKSRNDFLKDDLNILNSDIEVPQDISKKIQIDDDDDENKNTSNNNDDSKKVTPTPSIDVPTKNNKTIDPPIPDIKPYPEPANNDNKEVDKKTNSNKPEPIKTKMTLTANDYYSICSRQLNYTYDGEPIGLPPFIDSIVLLQTMDEQNQYTNILTRIIWSKLKGKAREYVPENSTVEEIKQILQNKIKVPSSKIVQGKFMALQADKTNLTDYATKAEELAEQLKRAYISEKIPNETANKMTIEQTIELCAKNTHSTQTKSVLEASQFDDAKEVIAQFIIQERKQTNQQQVLSMRGRNRFNRNFQGHNWRGRNQYHNNNHNNNYNNRNGYRGRGFNRGNNFNRNQHNNRGNGNQNANWRNNGNRQPRRGNVYYAENGNAPPPGDQPAQHVRIQQAEE